MNKLSLSAFFSRKFSAILTITFTLSPSFHPLQKPSKPPYKLYPSLSHAWFLFAKNPIMHDIRNQLFGPLHVQKNPPYNSKKHLPTTIRGQSTTPLSSSHTLPPPMNRKQGTKGTHTKNQIAHALCTLIV